MARNVLQDWVLGIPLRQQGVLMLALRGPDGVRKEHPSKAVIRSLRGCVMNAGRTGKAMDPGETFDGDSFMRMDLVCSTASWQKVCDDFFAEIDSYNLHFFQHLIHAAFAVGINHPIGLVAHHWCEFYYLACRKLHVKPETRDEFVHRLRDGRREEEDE